MKIVAWRRFCSGKVKQWAVLDTNGSLLFKSEHKGSCLRIIKLLEDAR